MALKRLSNVLFVAAITGAGAVHFPAPAVTVVESGSFDAEVQRHKNLAFGSNSNLYVTPTTQQLNDFKSLATALWSGNYQGTGSTTLDSQAEALGYEYVRFTDTDSGQLLYGLREKLVSGEQTKGWGTYFVNFSAVTDTIAQVPHTRFDINTEDMGGKVFTRAALRGFMMAGAHRYANGTASNGYGYADVAHVTNCVFHKVHEAFAGPTAQTTAYSIHGFQLSGFPAFEDDTECVLSSCDGQISDDVIEVDKRYEKLGIRTYAYNALSPSNSRNVLVNDGVPGSNYSGLGGSSNVQSQYSRNNGGKFMHLEHESSVRSSATLRAQAATAMGDAMRVREAIMTNNLKKWDGGTNGTSSSWTGSSGASWSDNGLPVATDTAYFDNSLVATLPAQMTLSNANMTIRGIVWNSNDNSQLVSATSTSNDSNIYLLGNYAESTWPLIQMGEAATSSTFTISNANTSTGAGQVKVVLSASGPIDVARAGATLQIDAEIDENLPGRWIAKTGPGTLVLTNTSNSFTGGITFAGGTLSTVGVSAAGGIPDAATADYYLFNGGAWRVSPTTTTAHTYRGITIAGGGGTLDVSTGTMGINGTVSGTGTWNKTGVGTLLLNNDTSAFSGTTIIHGGRVVPAANGAMGQGSAPVIVQNGGALVLRDGVNYQSVKPLTINGSGIGNTGALVNLGGHCTWGGTVSLGSNATIGVSANSLTLPNGISGVSTLSTSGAGSLNASRIRVGGLSLGTPHTAILPGRNIANTSRVTSLTLNGNTLDLGDNDLVIDYNGVSPLPAIRQAIIDAFNGGGWNGVGITSSLAPLSGFALGYAEAQALGIGTFNNIVVDSATVLIRYTRPGDSNLDGAVDSLDFNRIFSGFGASTGLWSDGDFNYDGKTNTLDFNLMAGNFGAAPAPSVELGAVVPEPAGISMLLLASLIGRRKVVRTDA